MKWLVPFLFLLTGIPCLAQGVIETSMGAGTLYNGSLDAGFGGTFYESNQQIYLGAVYQQGHVLPAASIERSLFGWDVGLGTGQVGFTADGVGFVLPLVGVSAKRKFGKTNLQFFSGATGMGAFLPWAESSRLTNVTNGLLLSRQISHLKLTGFMVQEGGIYSVLGAAQYNVNKVSVAGSAGLLNDQKYSDMSAAYRFKYLTVGASHMSFFSPVKAQGNALNLTSAFGRWMVSGSLNQSSSFNTKVTGENASVGVRIHFVTWQTGLYHSGDQMFVSDSVTEQLRRWTLTENITQAHGQNHFNFGLDYRGERWSAGLSHSIAFLLNGSGYQQVVSVHLDVRLFGKLRDTEVAASTVINPVNGKPLWSIGQTSFIQAGGFMPGRQTETSFRGVMIQGRCETPAHEPISGCYVEINRIGTYSNDLGDWSVRTKPGTYPVVVDMSKFITPGMWRVISAPKVVSPNESVTIIVEHE